MSLPAPGALLAGIGAAARVPLVLRGKRLLELMEPPASPAPPAAAPRGAVGAAVYTVALLGRIPGLPWRNTCLYRSVAECLVLRRYGVPAFVRIGVRTEQGPEGPVAAHAWVARAGEDGAEPTPGHNERAHALLARR